MATMTPQRAPRAAEYDLDAVIEEARRRQRRRRRALAASLLIAIAGIAVAYAFQRTSSHRLHTAQADSPPLAAPNGTIQLERPGALALGRGGILYISDRGRDQVIERLPNGVLRVLAGTGRRGFSGDGGPARRAELRDPAGLAVAQSGTIYVADQGNNRIRAISPEGVIRTIAGSGRGGWVRTGTPALAAQLLSPSAVAIDSHGRLTIAALGSSEVLRLEPDDTLTRLAGVQTHAGVYGIGGPAVRASVDGPAALAYDNHDNLYIAGSNTKSLLMVSAEGLMTLPSANRRDYPSPGGMTATPGGRVIVNNRSQILELTPTGAEVLVDFARLPHAVAAFKSFDATGIAADTAGNLYADTWPTGYTSNSHSGLILIHPSGTVRMLWRSS